MTNLDGTSVIIGGTALLYFVSPGQINAQVPFELTAGQPYQLIVSANGAPTTPQTIQLGAVTPGWRRIRRDTRWRSTMPTGV